MDNSRTVSLNRKAYHDYSIEDTVEAGLALLGTEIKSIRAGHVNLRDAYARPEDGELWLVGAHIAQYPQAHRQNHDPGRPRKLLLHRKEIDELTAVAKEKRLTLVPVRLYLKKGRAKVEVGIAKGKRSYDKRDAMAKQDAQRTIERAVKASRERTR